MFDKTIKIVYNMNRVEIKSFIKTYERSMINGKKNIAKSFFCSIPYFFKGIPRSYSNNSGRKLLFSKF